MEYWIGSIRKNSEAKETILFMNDNKEKLMEQSNICKNWWSDIKKKYQENFKLVIDNG